MSGGSASPDRASAGQTVSSASEGAGIAQAAAIIALGSVSSRVLGFDFDGSLVVLDGLVDSPEIHQRVSPIVVNGMDFRIDLQGLLVMPDGLLELPLSEKGIAEVAVISIFFLETLVSLININSTRSFVTGTKLVISASNSSFVFFLMTL